MGEMMRILLVVNEFPPEKIAGTAMATKALAEHLVARGHQVMVLVTTTCPPEKQPQIEEADYELVWLPKWPVRGIGILWRVLQTLKHARRFRPQLIQGQAVSCGLVAAVVGKWLNIPSLCYAQGYDVYQASRWQKRTEIRWGCLWPDRLLAVTRNLADAIRQVVGGRPLQIMPHAFTMPEDCPSRESARHGFELTENMPVVFSVGRLEVFKGHDVLLQAWPDILRHQPQARLWIAGSGSCRESLQQQAQMLGIEDSVSFAGHLAADEVHVLMAAADLFVLPSRSEPFGIVLLEAMAHGLPVVASNVGGIPEVVPNHGDVQLVPADDVQALALAVSTGLQQPFQASKVNRAHAMNFEWQQQVGRFEALYREMLGFK